MATLMHHSDTTDPIHLSKPKLEAASTSLTPSQESTLDTCLALISEFKILVIKGEAAAGKYTVATELFRRLDAFVELFDLCELAKHTDRELSNQDVIQYLELLLQRLNARMNQNNTTKRRRTDIESKISELSLDQDNFAIASSQRKSPGIIYIRHYNRVADVLTDCYSKVRFLLPLILKTFSENMPDDVRIIITTHGCLLPEGLHWCVDLTSTRSDMEHILSPFYSQGRITKPEYQYILKISRTVPIGRMLFCIKYALAMMKPRPNMKQVPNITSNYNRTQEGDLEKNFLIESYRKALSRFSGSTVDIDRDVPKPIPEDDLVGVEEIIDEITTSIINPMRLGVTGIPIKKGLLMCGPPGTGKTSIGRWLAHQIKGKFYLIRGEAGINGPTLIETFQSTVRKAHENGPAVVFIDDGDVLFDHDDTYRAFLTILDGIETNQRSDVCVILTCMNMRRVPASLLRGGRLEMALVTRLPDRKKIQIILERSLSKMQVILHDYDAELSDGIFHQLHKDFVSDISIKMVGWNCADIHRCVNDVSRLIISNKGTNMAELFERCIRQIREQYELCGRCESTNLDDRTHESYIQ